MKPLYSKSAPRENMAVVILPGKKRKIGTFSTQNLPFLISRNACLNFHSPFHAGNGGSNCINTDRKSWQRFTRKTCRLQNIGQAFSFAGRDETTLPLPIQPSEQRAKPSHAARLTIARVCPSTPSNRG